VKRKGCLIFCPSKRRRSAWVGVAEAAICTICARNLIPIPAPPAASKGGASAGDRGSRAAGWGGAGSDRGTARQTAGSGAQCGGVAGRRAERSAPRAFSRNRAAPRTLVFRQALRGHSHIEVRPAAPARAGWTPSLRPAPGWTSESGYLHQRNQPTALYPSRQRRWDRHHPS
jgi:hypothetical protein